MTETAIGEGEAQAVGGRRERCEWCQMPLSQPTGRGRPRRFCRPSCRQAAYVERRVLGGDGSSVEVASVRREALEELRTLQAMLAAALRDAERDLADATDADDVRRILDWVRQHAAPLARTTL